ncbi:MAG TPA: hypothetical protein VJR89_38945, partial [Polyangiales bacterium]|nr:hypothetical protein [Polyangiales bacterium]
MQVLRALCRTQIRILGLCLLGFGAGLTSAQAQGSGIALTVRGLTEDSTRCFEVGALRERIEHYGEARLARAEELQLELYAESRVSAELRVYRGREVVARRRFENLPEACADRRDAVALSIALALDGVAREIAPTEPTDSEPPAAAAAEPADAAPVRPEAEASREPEPVVRDEPAAATATAAPQDSAPASDTAAAAGGVARVQLHVGTRWLAHALPAGVWTGTLGVELGFGRHFAIDVSGMASTVGNSTFAGGSAESWLAGGEIMGCGALPFGAFAAQGCAGDALAACQAHGNYPREFPDATLLWAARTARLALRWPAQSWIS